MTALSSRIEAKVRVTFAPEDTCAAIAALKGMKEPSLDGDWALTRERVHIAILILAQSSLAQLLKIVSSSQVDWRDTLVGAGLGGGDWHTVAREAGFDVA